MREFSKNIQISNFMKIRPVGDELFHSDGWPDGQTNMTKLTAAFRNSATALKESLRITQTVKTFISKMASDNPSLTPYLHKTTLILVMFRQEVAKVYSLQSIWWVMKKSN